MANRVIVVDDDPIVGNLTLELLKDAGFESRLVEDGAKAQDEIKRERPALVILDILMPGIDGLTLLHRLKSDPETAGIRVVVVSGKSFEAEKERARQYGAELFIEKPYDVDTFGARIAAVIKSAGAESEAAARPPSTPAPEPRAGLKISVWGCRSSSSSAPPDAGRYGRRTSCVSVELPRHMIVFDAGSGLVPLGGELMQSARFKELWMFLTHFHRDHVEGLADFPCARDASYALNISGAGEPGKPLEAMLAEALAPGFGDGSPPCRIALYEMMEQTYEILPGARMTAFYANHPGTTLGYALQAEKRKIVYCPDSEVYGEAATALQDYDEKLGALAREADVLIHDGRFTVEDYKVRRNAGHSSFLAAVDLAGRNGVKHLVLVHQDGDYADEVLDKMGEAADARVSERGYAMKVTLGREGLRLAV